MKEKKIPKWAVVVIILVLLAVFAVAGRYAFRVYRFNTLVQQQNYVAAKLIEMGDYEQGRMMASQNIQLKENQISKQLLVLSAGFQSDYASGVRYADTYLAEKEDEIIGSARSAMEDFVASEAKLEKDSYEYYDACEVLKTTVWETLLKLLLEVENDIHVKRNSENVQAMLELMSQGTMLSEQTMQVLEGDDSSLGKKLQAAYAIQTGDYSKAYEKAEEIFRENDSFENRAMLANLIAKHGEQIQGEDATLDGLYEAQRQSQEKLYDLQNQYAQSGSEAENRRLSRQIEDVQAQIDDYQDQIQREPVQRAINFIETTTPIVERNTMAYKLELAQLYYQAKNREKAQELLVDVIKEDDGGSEPAALLMQDFVQFYRIINGQEDKPAYLDTNTMNVGVIWNRIAQLLNFIESGYYYEESESFYGYVLSVLDALYNGVIIRKIDATDFPIVRVTVNVAMELEEQLQKKDFAVKEMHVPINDFELLGQEALENSGDQEMSVVLVVDRSGSMAGTRMDDTKKAVSNFVKNIGDNVRVGLVTFESSARTDCPISDNQNLVLQAIRNVNANGGTSIFSGLQEASSLLDGEYGQRIIILLSDGEDGDAGRIDEILEELKRKDIYVYSIGFGGADTEYLSYIASQTRGKFIQADSSEMLGEIYSAVGEYMVNDYVLEFEVTVDPEEFSRIVNISVDVNDAFAEQKYSVGVPYDDILQEQNESPLADYFRQIGGSWMNGQ